MSNKYKCTNHPTIEAKAVCAHCGKFICRECIVKLDKQSYCKDCAVGIKENRIEKSTMTYPNWFKRHLNLTLVITTFSPLLVAGIIGALIGDWALPIGFLTAYVVMAVGAGWVLHRKARSLFWLFLFFVPFGFWILLLLGNKSENPD